MSDPRAWLAEAQERASKATPGPWDHQPWGGQNQNGDYAGGEVFADGEYLIHDVSDEDGAFIAHARTDVPRMAAALTAVLDLQAHTAGPDAEPGGDADMWCQGYRDGLEAARRAITEHLTKEVER